MDDELKTAYRICQSIARREAGNFYWAFRFLPKRKRWALSAVYAFCRIADDLVDDATDAGQARRDLQSMLQDFDAAMSGSPDGPMYVALADACRRFSISRQHFEDLIHGVAMDLDEVEYGTVEDVEVYCRRVASSVGQMSIAIFGARHPDSRRYADELGLALQWTNILRDVGEDADRGRVYIPNSMLQDFQIRREDVLAKSDGVPWQRLFSAVYDHALARYRKADDYLPRTDLRHLVVAEIMKSIYLATLHKLRRLDYPVLQRRVSLSVFAKARISLTVVFLRGILVLRPRSDRFHK